MKYTVGKEFTFEAAHSLPHLPKGHKCRNLHGHSYRLVVFITDTLDKARGWVIDYADISDVVERKVISVLDHQNINDFVPVSTAENLADWIWNEVDDEISGLSRIELYETGTSVVVLER